MRTRPRLVFAGLIAAVVAGPVTAQQATDAEYLGRVQEWSRQLVNDLDYLQQDLSYDVPGQRGRELAELAAVAYQRARQLHRGLKVGVSREQLYKDFSALDAPLHKLLHAVRSLPANERSIHRAAARVHNADQQLHHALSHGDETPARVPEVLTRQIRLLAQQASELSGTIDWATGGSSVGARMRKAGSTFSAAAQQLRVSVEEGYDQEKVRRDFVQVANAWREVVGALNAPEANPAYYLRTKASQTHETVERLRQRLNQRDPYVQLRDID